MRPGCGPGCYVRRPMFAAAVLALTLARPAEVFEDWSLVETAPLREAVTVRALYLRRDGDAALLPPAVQGGAQPVAYALGQFAPLTVTRGAQGWQVDLPPGDRDRVRVIARTVRPTEAPRLFRLRWPRTTSGGTPTRRVATVPRAWLDGSPRGWTCPDEPEDDLPCVSSVASPSPLTLRASALPSPRGAVPVAWGLTALALVLSAWRPAGRAERLLAAVGGAAAALSVALAVVGAHWASWGIAGAVLVPAGALAGAVAPGTRAGRLTGSVALLAVPLVAVLDGRARDALAAAVVAVVAVAWGARCGRGARADRG